METLDGWVTLGSMSVHCLQTQWDLPSILGWNPGEYSILSNDGNQLNIDIVYISALLLWKCWYLTSWQLFLWVEDGGFGPFFSIKHNPADGTDAVTGFKMAAWIHNSLFLYRADHIKYHLSET